MSTLNNKKYPLQRCKTFGIESLTDEELLSVVLLTEDGQAEGTELPKTIFQQIFVNERGLSGILFLTYQDLLKIPGISEINSAKLMAIAELSRRIRQDSAKASLCFSSPSTVSEYYMDRFRGLNREYSLVIFLDSGLKPINEEILSVGSVNRVMVDAREIYSKALCCKAYAIMLIHNHPSGRVSPSAEDCKLTNYLREYGDFLGIRFLDHLILGDNRYYSFSEHEL